MLTAGVVLAAAGLFVAVLAAGDVLAERARRRRPATQPGGRVVTGTPVHDALVLERGSVRLRDDVEACLTDYRAVWPRPHQLAPNLQLLVRACDLLGVPVREDLR